jgi:hypothetical protein
MAAMPALSSLCKERSLRAVAATHPATLPLVGLRSQSKRSLNAASVAFNNAVVDFIRARRVGDVILIAYWSAYLDDHDPARLRRGLLDTMEALKDSGARVWIMRQVPAHPWDVPKAVASAICRGQDPEQLGLPVAEHRKLSRSEDAILEGLAAQCPGVTFLNPTDLFVDDAGLCRMVQGGKTLYSDKDHLTLDGAMLLRPLFEPIFAGTGRRPTDDQPSK